MLDQIKKIIIQDVYQKFDKQIGIDGMNWIFDFRRVTLTPNFLNIYVQIFFEIFEKDFENGKKFQVCGLESASISLLSAIVLESQKGGLNINGFFLRKGKKKHDLMNDIEGLPNVYPVIIIDDILNSGGTVKKQIEILKRDNIKVAKVFTILRFRDLEFYDFLKVEGVEVISLFDLNDFGKELNLKNKISDKDLQPLKFEVIWSKKYAKGNFKLVVRKSAPILDNGKIYFGTDEGYFFCVDATNGDIIWKHKILFGADGKFILSSPKIFGEYVFFGAYDGNFYCLDKNTGKKNWIYLDADWIGSSPCISPKLNLVYIGLEYGYFSKKGGIAAIDINTGKEVWRDQHDGLTHCSPYVSDTNNLLFCGSNDGILRIYNSKTGEKLKEHNVGAEIKDSFAENADHTFVAFGSFANKLTIINTKTLEISNEFETYEAIYSTPVWDGDNLIFTCLDKKIYNYDSKNKIKKWEFLTNSRIFSDPLIIDNFVYVGNNGGNFYKINKETGKHAGYLQFAERIVNKAIYDKGKNQFFIPTLAHEIYCIKFEIK